MKLLLTLLFFCVGTITIAQNKNPQAGLFDKDKKLQRVEASCGQCKLGLKGTSCDLAVRIDGKSYFVNGIHIDSLGDAHSEDGFYNAIRKAEVQGEIKNDRFIANYILLLPVAEKK